VDNAIKFTPAGKNVTLTIEVDQSGSRVFTNVSDAGIGIPFGRLPELFHTFHQLDGSATQGSVFSFELPVAYTGG
jgi:signal transduction histidine kinase